MENPKICSGTEPDFFPNIFLRLRLRLLISDGTSDGVWVSLNKMKTDLDHEKSPQLLQLAANAVKCIGTIWTMNYYTTYLFESQFWNKIFTGEKKCFIKSLNQIISRLIYHHWASGAQAATTQSTLRSVEVSGKSPDQTEPACHLRYSCAHGTF